MLTRRTILAASTVAALGAGPPHTRAQTLKKTAHMIVGFPAGGATDLIARILADRLRGRYAASVIVENKPGGAARVAVDYIKNAEPDGSEILFTPDFPITLYPHSFRTLSYDPMRDLVPVAPASRSTLTFVVGPAVPDQITSLVEYVAWCRAYPEKAIFATTAAGGTPHFVGVMLANEARVKLTPVHYRGGAPALQDLFGGHVPASVNPVGETLPHAASGKIRILAVASGGRSKFMPNVPTMREAGYNIAVETWLGAFAPAKTPPEAVRALNAAIGEAVRSPEMIESLAKIGNDTRFESPDQFAATIRADLERWGPIVKASGFVAEE
ncbi:MAG TPA: tripartite tricarboxylate transporter substrate-binding protein [Xanthobacteraceae bacterium]|jgi:tripartite-type tricarboxylate transporter receptor subunit TctC|nr:tripartite tricarboxylate transporter substrate-binding protein [Xanthobacteraceae bacterium]